MCYTLNKCVFGATFTFLVIGALAIFIASLSITWLEGSLDVGFTSIYTKVTLTKVKYGFGTSSPSETSATLKSYCDQNSSGSFVCKLYRASDALITLTSFGLAALAATGVLIIVNLCSSKKKETTVFKVIYVITSLVQFALFLISFIVYTAIAEDGKGDNLNYETGWILYIVGLALSLIICAGSIANMKHVGDFLCCFLE